MLLVQLFMAGQYIILDVYFEFQQPFYQRQEL